MQCAIKKLTVDESEWTFLSQKGLTLLRLVSTWEDQLIKERVAAAAAEEVEAEVVTVIVMTIEVTAVAAEVAEMTIEVTAEVEAAAEGEVVTGTAEIAADHLLHTIVLNVVVHVPDPSHPAVIDRNGKTI